MSQEKITNIFWDFGAVLFSNAQISGYEFKPVRKLLGITPERSDEIFFSMWEEGVRLGKISEDDFWNTYIENSTQEPNLEEIKVIYRKCTLVNSELLNLISQLSNKYVNSVVSNHGKEWMNFLISNYNLNNIFKDIVCSAFIGIGKPDPEFFEIALKRVSVKPQNVIYIDNEERHLEAARSIGIHSILYSGFYENMTKGNKDLVSKLKSEGLV